MKPVGKRVWMSSLLAAVAVSLIVFACVFGGALLGILLHAVLPENHLSAESKDIVKLGMGLVGTMAALVLGLLVASAKGSYDAQSTELKQMSANIAFLDRVLAFTDRRQRKRALCCAAPLLGFSIRCDLKTAPPEWHRRPPVPKFFTTKSRDSRRRATRSARSKARR